MTFFSCLLKCISMNNEECKIITNKIVINNNEPSFYPYNIKINKYSGSCNNNNDPDAKFCVPDFVKNINIKVFNLIPRTNEARHIEWHETCKCKFRLDVSVFNNKHRWKNNKSICERKELIDKGICNKGFVWSLSNYECQCDKSCHIDMNFYENIWNIKIVGVEKI